MESEEFYDSLEEDSSYESVEIGPPLKINESKVYEDVTLAQKKSEGQNSDRETQTTYEYPSTEEDIIPFYDKNLNKSEIDLNSSKCNSDSGSSKNKSRKNVRRKKSKFSITDYNKTKSNSYLQIFRSKIRVDSNKEDFLDSCRATCSELTPKSYTTCEDLDMGSVHSLDFSEPESIDGDIKNRRDGLHFSLSMASLDSKLYSVSEQNILNTSGNRKGKIKKYTKLIPNRIPELGSLGPEIPKDKLELLKKRQQYGQKVSQMNKIKMIEKKLLRNLQQEIKECNKVI